MAAGTCLRARLTAHSTLLILPVFHSATQIGQVAQLVERGPEKAGVGGSIPSLATPKDKAKVERRSGELSSSRVRM